MNINILNKKEMKMKSTRLYITIILVTAILLSGCISSGEEPGSSEVEVESKVISVVNESLEDTSTLEEEIEKHCSLLPAWCRDKLTSEEWILIYTPKEIESIYSVPDDTGALTDLETKTIYVETGRKTHILHELIHACLYNSEKKVSRYIEYDGIESEMNSSSLEPYYKENYDEYIVECISIYLRDEDALNEFPLTKRTVQEMLESSTWLYE